MQDSEYRRRSAPNEFFPNGEVDLTDLDCLTKTCSVGDLNKGDNCLNIAEQPKVLTSSPIASRLVEARPAFYRLCLVHY